MNYNNNGLPGFHTLHQLKKLYSAVAIIIDNYYFRN